MDNLLENKYSLAGCLCSLFIYIGLVALLFLYTSNTKENPKKYTSNEDKYVAVSIDLDSPQKENPKSNPKPQINIKKEAQKTTPKEKFSKDDIKISSLFSQIKDTNLKPQKSSNTYNESALKSLNEKEKPLKLASSIVNELNITNADEKNQKSYSLQGIYDAYYSKIESFLQQEWEQTYITRPNNEAYVEFLITKNGTFKYKILKLSYDGLFNNKLVQFLNNLNQNSFYPFREFFPKGENETAVEIKFVDK